MAIIQRLAEHVDDFGGAVKQLESATECCRIQLLITTLPATFVLIDNLMEYQWMWTKKVALVLDIMVGVESVRRLRQYTKQYFSDTMQWEELYAAVYVEPARIFQLAGSGVTKKQQGIPDEAFIELVTEDCRAIDLGKLSWAEPEHLMA